MKHWTDKLVALNACQEAVEWAKAYDSLTEAWAECERGDWMLWLAGYVCGGPRSKSRKILVSAACECARIVWQWMPWEDKKAVQTAEKWASGETTLDEVRAAVSYAASYATAPASDASYAASYAASSAASVYYAAAAAYYASAAASDAFCAYYASSSSSSSAAAALEGKKWNKKCADIVHKHYPRPPTMPTMLRLVDL